MRNNECVTFQNLETLLVNDACPMLRWHPPVPFQHAEDCTQMNLSKTFALCGDRSRAAKTPAQRRNWLVTSLAAILPKKKEIARRRGCRLSVRGPTRTACVSHINELASVQIHKLFIAHSESVFVYDQEEDVAPFKYLKP